MSLFKICDDDLLTKTLRDTFQAIPVRIPEERIKPLGAIAKLRKTDKWYGLITNLLNDTAKYPGEIIESKVANVSMNKSKQVDFDLGFDIMSGFLNGMGIDGSSLKAKFRGVKKVSFSFENVKRCWVDIGELGAFLKGKNFDIENPANKIFTNVDAICLVVDSTINSNNFRLNIEQRDEHDFNVDIPSIKDYLGSVKSNIKVDSNSEESISFAGDAYLAFAFSTISFHIDEDDSISFIPEEYKELSTRSVGNFTRTIYTPNKVLLYSDAGMINFD